MTPIQMRMARAAVGWGVRELAEKAGITANTVTRIENGSDAKQSTIYALRRALEAAGVIFVAENGEGAGVRLKKKPMAVAELSEKIDSMDEKIETILIEGPPSPERGLNQMKKAHAQNERTKLKNRRTKIKNGRPK